MTDCSECAIAQDEPYHMIFLAGCETCVVRHLSDAPRMIRDRYLETIRDDGERERLRVAIVAEYHRRKALLDEVARRALGLAA